MDSNLDGPKDEFKMESDAHGLQMNANELDWADWIELAKVFGLGLEFSKSVFWKGPLVFFIFY